MKQLLHKIVYFLVNGSDLEEGVEYVVLSSNV